MSKREGLCGGGSTNDIGEFRIGRLDPGTYLLLAVPHRNMGADEPASDPPPPQPLATYFPGTPALDQAQSMLLGRGQSVSGIEVVIAEGVPAAEAPGPPVTPAALRREFVSGLRPGDYYVIAVDDLESELVREPSVLERLSTAAARVTIVEGAAVDVNLRRVNASEVLGAR